MMYLKNVGKRALALVLALMMCVGMLSTTVFADDVPEVKETEESTQAEVKEPETTEDEVTIENVQAPLAAKTLANDACDHNWAYDHCDKLYTTICNSTHKDVFKCTKCGEEQERWIGATGHGHDFDSANNIWEIGNEQTHTAHCSRCTAVRNENHNYVGATCTEPGVCVCGKVDPEGTLDPTNHANTETVTVAATCLNKGSVTVTCKDCENTVSSTITDEDPSNHDATCTVNREFDTTDHWTVRTCDAIGTKEAHQYHEGENECYVCGYKKTTEPPVDPTEPVDPTDKCEHGEEPDMCVECHKKNGDHTYKLYSSNNDATCIADGTETATCTFPGCGEKDTRVVEGTKLDHSFTNYVPNNDATCMKDGTKTATCDRCDETKTIVDEGSQLPHDFSGKLVPLNLDEHVMYCANGCGTHSEPVAHSFDITVGGHPNAVQATCQHMGIEVTQCKCGLEHYEVIEKLDHNYVDGKCTMCGKYADHECSFTVEGAVIREATCAQKGLKWYSCGVCGSSTAVEYEDWKNHAGYHESARVAATCEDDEKVSFVCVGCGDTYDTTIPDTATGHTPNDPVEENRVAPQIGVPGSYDSVVYCDVCGKELSRTPNTIPALFDDQVYIDDNDIPLGGDPDGGDGEVELDDNAIPLAGPVTRAEFVDYLYRREGSPEAGLSTFEDVSADHEYAYAIGWGQANDIAYGVSATEFLPDELVTVGQAKLFLSRYAKLKGIEMPELAALVGLDDQDYAMNCDEILGEFFGSDE